MFTRYSNRTSSRGGGGGLSSRKVQIFPPCKDQKMDGDAICAAFASSPGPDTLRDLIPKLGIRMIKSALDLVSFLAQPQTAHLSLPQWLAHGSAR